MSSVLFALQNTKKGKPMKIRERKDITLVASGIILGASIAAPAAGAALMAQQSSQKITVDGKPARSQC